MGLGRSIRSIDDTPSYEITSKNLISGVSETFYIHAGISPQWEEGSDHYGGFMSIPGMWRASLLISDILGQIPWHLYDDGPNGQLKSKDQPPFLEQPEPPWTRINTISGMVLDLFWHGNAIMVVTGRRRDGVPSRGVAVPAENVHVAIDEDTGRLVYRIGSQLFDQSEVIHIKGPAAPGQLRGMGVIESQRPTLFTSKEQTKATKNFSNNGIPTGVLKSENPDLTREEALDLKAVWMEAQANRTIAVLNASTTFEPLAWNPTEMQMVEARKFTLHEIALITGLPLSFLGVETSNRTYRNDESEGIGLIKWGIGGFLARFEQALSLQFPRGKIVRANLDAILRSSTQDRYAAHRTGIEAGFILRSEARKWENLPAIPGIDDKPLPGMAQGSVDSGTKNNDSQPNDEEFEDE